jgi:hypothetical protein
MPNNILHLYVKGWTLMLLTWYFGNALFESWLGHELAYIIRYTGNINKSAVNKNVTGRACEAV